MPSITKPDGRQFVLRRTWPQRLLIVAACGVIAVALLAVWATQTVYGSVKNIGRVQISSDVLLAEPETGGSLNFLIVGIDSADRLDPGDRVRAGRASDARGRHNADTIVVIRADPNAESVAMLSIPRDVVVTHPHTSNEYKVNAMNLVGGPELLIEAISTNFGVPVNHYVEVDFHALRQVVDLLGGVEVHFDYPERDSSSLLSVESAGTHLLDGSQALAYLRSRHTEQLIDGSWRRVPASLHSPDIHRIGRQQGFLSLAADRAIQRGARSPDLLADLIDAAAGSLVFDSELTVAALVSLGQDFTGVASDELVCYQLEVRPEQDYVSPQGTNLGSVLHVVGDANEAYFDVFRGEAPQGMDSGGRVCGAV